MSAPRGYPQELWGRAIRLMHEARLEDPEWSLNAVVIRIGQPTAVKLDTVRGWAT